MIAQQADKLGSEFLRDVIAGTPGGERIVHCLQCGSCGGSCPNGADMQYTPRTLFALINANKREVVLKSNTMWCCVSCYFFTTRCPQNIPITDIMYQLKRMAIAENLAKDTDAPPWPRRSPVTSTGTGGRSVGFGKPFTCSINRLPCSRWPDGPGHVRWPYGDAHESARRPTASHHQESPRDWERIVKYAYYPGCSMEVNAAAYDMSMREVAKVLDLEFAEIDDWNCCGATEYFSQDELTACSVVARNLAIAGSDANQLVASCAACYCNLAKVDKLMSEDAEMGKKINLALAAGDLKYRGGSVRIRHLLDVICSDVGEENQGETRPSPGCVAPYYGCRPCARSRSAYRNTRCRWICSSVARGRVVDYPVKAHAAAGHANQRGAASVQRVCSRARSSTRPT